MTLIGLLVIVIVLAIVFWLLQRYVAATLPAPWGNLILAVAALLVIVWLLSRVGILPDLNTPIFR